MANIKVKDLTSINEVDLSNYSDSFIRDLSKCELSLQGGKKHRQPAPPAIPPVEVPGILQGFAPYSIF
jgi:hypothetical protein